MTAPQPSETRPSAPRPSTPSPGETLPAARWSTPAVAYVLAVLAMLFWSGNIVFGRGLVGVVEPFVLSWCRWTMASLLVLPFTWRELFAKRAILRRDWKFLVGVTVGGLLVSNTATYIGLESTTAINAGLINSVGPMVVLAISSLAFGDHARPVQFLGVVVSLAGVVAIIVRGDPQLLASITLNGGDLLMLLAVTTWSLYTIVIRYRPKELSPLGLLAAFFAIGSVSLLPIVIVRLASGMSVPTAPTALAGMLYVGIFPSVLSILCWNRALQIIGANRASVFTHLMPLFCAVLAMAFLGESLEVFHLIGALLIFGGIFLAATAKTT